jgi:DNA mismatch repair protein MutL
MYGMHQTEPNPSAPSREKGGIHILPPHLINRIAAGEVVERPASVVKELVENALDAGATRIDISAGLAGRHLRVADNGCGMPPEDAALAFYNHATSKIHTLEDLNRIETLGFRGEALASIGSISKLTCWTRTADAAMGTKIALNELGEPVLSEAGCAPGTVMEVDDLFYNTPARLKFLKRPQTEMSHIEETVQYLALSHPEARFTLTLNDKEVLKTTGSGELRRTMDEVFGLKRESINLISVTAEDELAGLRLAGFTSEPGVMKSSKRWLVTYVNGRHVRCAVLQKSIEAAYESLLPQGKYPVAVFFLNMPATDVDVNVHPTKREVRYAAANPIFSFLRQGILNSLSAQGISLEPLRPSSSTPQKLLTPHFSLSPHLLESSQSSVLSKSNLSTLGQEKSGTPSFYGGAGLRRNYATEPQSSQAALNFYQPGRALQRPDAPVDFSQDESSLSASTLARENGASESRFKVVGQLFNTYILLETSQGLMVVDQHIASERKFFEALTRNLTAETPAIQHLLVPQSLMVSPVQQDLLLLYQPDFQRLGFLYQKDDEEKSLALTGYPLVYAGRDQMFQRGGLFENLLAQLEETGEMKLDLDHLIATLACHSAVRAGDNLTAEQMEQVIEGWLACQLPWTCPHGRPIAHTISKGELNHFFHRPSLPVSAL